MTRINESIHIRDAYEHEQPAIRDLTLAAYEQYATIMRPSAWSGLKTAILNAVKTASPVERIVAEQNGGLVGSVMLFPAAISAYGQYSGQSAVPELRLLAVADTARGQGVGRALVEACVERARQAGATELGLHTSESMQAAMHLYTTMGFVRFPPDDFRPEGAELVMAYRLPLTDRQDPG